MPDPDIEIRPESEGDTAAIKSVVSAAFLDAPHTSHTEEFIVNALRRAGQLTVSLVASHDGEIVGHVAISPVKISGADVHWFGLGPVAVLPAYQRGGLGSALIMQALVALSNGGAEGCVVLGDPGYYERFGFKAVDSLTLPGVPPAFFMAVAFGSSIPAGVVSYHEAFEARS